MAIDWSFITSNLSRAYRSMEKLAEEADMCPTTLTRMAYKGTEPRFANGQKLLELHMKHCPHLHDLINKK